MSCDSIDSRMWESIEWTLPMMGLAVMTSRACIGILLRAAHGRSRKRHASAAPRYDVTEASRRAEALGRAEPDRSTTDRIIFRSCGPG